MNWKVIIGLGLLSTVGVAAYGFYKRQEKLIRQYTIKIIGVKVLQWSTTVAKIQFTVRVNNVSDVEATITKLYADMYLNNVFVGNVSTVNESLIPAKGYSDIKGEISFAPKEVLKNLVSTLTVFLSQKDIPYQLKGYIKIKSSFINIPLPLDYKGNLKSDIMGNIPLAIT